jgi:hypothetical protein
VEALQEQVPVAMVAEVVAVVVVDMAAALTVAADTAADWVGALQRPRHAAPRMGTLCQTAQAFHAPMRCTQLIWLATNTPKSNA